MINNDEMVILTYHTNHQVISCHCGVEIGIWEHECILEVPCYKIKVVECTYNSREVKSSTAPTCTLCKEKEKEKEYSNQWYCNDDDGYSRCMECGNKCDEYLPKNCGCLAYDEKGQWYYEDLKCFCVKCDTEWKNLYPKICKCMIE